MIGLNEEKNRAARADTRNEAVGLFTHLPGLYVAVNKSFACRLNRNNSYFNIHKVGCCCGSFLYGVLG